MRTLAVLAFLILPAVAMGQGKSFKDNRVFLDQVKVGDKGVIVYPAGVVGFARKPIMVEIIEVIDKHTFTVRYPWKGQTKYHHIEIKGTTDSYVTDQEITLTFPVHVSGVIEHAGRRMFRMVEIE